jgi:hypothetical protein
MKTSGFISISLVCLLLCFCTLQAQQSGDGAGRLALTVWMPDNIDGLTPIAEQNLKNKLAQIISQSGIFAEESASRFIMTANVITLDKHVLPGAPPKYMYTMDVTLYIGDGLEGLQFSSYNTTVSGVGNTETKAHMTALSNIKTNDRNFQSFITRGKSKIIDYFESRCDVIIRQATVSAGMNNYNDALRSLMSVPDVCTECWNKAMDTALPIYQEQIDFDCKSILLEATNVWNAGQSWNAAERAGRIMSTINPHASCFGDVMKLAGSIEKRIRDVDAREWKFKYDKEIDLKRSLINAYRDVGVAYGTNQRSTSLIYKSLW